MAQVKAPGGQRSAPRLALGGGIAGGRRGQGHITRSGLAERYEKAGSADLRCLGPWFFSSRYFTRMDYSGLPAQNYRQVNLVSLPSWEVRQFWLTLAIVLGLLALVWVYRCASDGAAHSIFFCSLLIIEPNVQRLAYVTMLWPALYAGIIMTDRKAPRFTRWVLMGAAALAVLEPLVPGAASQRLGHVLGIDFFGVLVPVTIVHLAYSSWGMSSPLWKPLAK